jgi:Uma2 family endonuclease
MLASTMVAARKLDPTIYPETDYMGEGELQQLIDELLRPLLARFLAERKTVGHVGSNTFIYYRQFDSSKRIAPDIYVLPGTPQERIGRSWKLWELPSPPSFALEVVSLDVEKDYIEAPEIHERIGTREVVIFDPDARGRKERKVWQVHARARDGKLRLRERTDADRVQSRELGCFLRVVGKGDAQRIRLATGARGQTLFPTEAEVERAEKEREQKARRIAEAENSELRKEIERLRSGGVRSKR